MFNYENGDCYVTYDSNPNVDVFLEIGSENLITTYKKEITGGVTSVLKCEDGYMGFTDADAKDDFIVEGTTLTMVGLLENGCQQKIVLARRSQSDIAGSISANCNSKSADSKNNDSDLTVFDQFMLMEPTL